MKTKTKEKVYAERQHNYKTKKEEIFKKALDYGLKLNFQEDSVSAKILFSF